MEVSLEKCSPAVDDLFFEIQEVSRIGCAGAVRHLCVVQQHVRATWSVLGGVGGPVEVSLEKCSPAVADLFFEIWEVSRTSCAGASWHLCVVQQHV